jgi:hypothetical protein
MRNSALWNLEPCRTGFLAPGKTLLIRGIMWAAALYAITFGFMVVCVF